MKKLLLYKYMKECDAQKTLCGKRLKVSTLSDMNDPYEWLVCAVDNAGVVVCHSAFCKQTIQDKFADKYGIICLSQSNSSPVLWAHYADKHRGVALELELPDSGSIEKVVYGHRRATWNLDQERQSRRQFASVIRTKYIEWQYEAEYRHIVPLSGCIVEDGLFFVGLSKNYLKRIILGVNCELEEHQVRQLLDMNGYESTSIATAVFNETAYEMNIQP